MQHIQYSVKEIFNYVFVVLQYKPMKVLLSKKTTAKTEGALWEKD